MLLDFSDVLQASVRELGQVYMKLVRLLNLEKVLDIPVIDPSLFMERFASKLALGSMQSEVCHTAVRLIQVMSRDWICTGRRPTGLCGAALLIACRAHGVDKEADEIANLVRIGEVTIKRRLYELSNTSTAALTMDEFQAIEDFDPANSSSSQLASTNTSLIPASLPPALIRNRIKEAKAAKEKARFALEDAIDTNAMTGVELTALADGVLDDINPDGLSLNELIDEDDSDLDILAPHEQEKKKLLWHEWSKDWLEEWELKQETKKEQFNKKKQRKLNSSLSIVRKSIPPQKTAAEATRLALNRKTKKTHMDDGYLENLFTSHS